MIYYRSRGHLSKKSSGMNVLILALNACVDNMQDHRPVAWVDMTVRLAPQSALSCSYLGHEYVSVRPKKQNCLFPVTVQQKIG